MRNHVIIDKFLYYSEFFPHKSSVFFHKLGIWRIYELFKLIFCPFDGYIMRETVAIYRHSLNCYQTRIKRFRGAGY